MTRNEILTRLVPEFARGWLCRAWPRAWPWWCDHELAEAWRRASAQLEALGIAEEDNHEG